MFGKLSDDIIFTCQKCGRRVNPYAEYEGLAMSNSPEQVFNYMQSGIPCPNCQKYGVWEFKQ